MKLQKAKDFWGDVVYRVSARDADGRVWFVRYEAPPCDRTGAAIALWQARRVLRAELLNRGFWQPGDEGMAA